MSSAPRLVTPGTRDDDADVSLRPQRLSEFIGQEQARANLSVFIEAARARKEALDHVLLSALPAWARPLWHRFSRANWPSISAPRPAR